MAHLFQQKYTKPIPPGAKRKSVDGVLYASWTSAAGEKVTWPVSKRNPDRYVATSTVWSVRWFDQDGKEHVEHVSTIRRLAEKRKHAIEDMLENVRHGVLPAAVARPAAGSLEALLEEWERAICDDGNSAEHAALYRRRANVLLKHCGASRPAELNRADVTATLARFRREGVPAPDGTGRPISVETSNHYLTAGRALVRWCVERGYLAGDQLVGCKKLNADAHRTFERRPLTPDEFDRLLAVTAARKKKCAISGPDRAMCYLLTAYTGCRLKEVSKLTPASFRLDQSPPVVQLPASKGKPPVVQVLHESIVGKLKRYLADKQVDQPLWYGYVWAKEGRASKVLRSDLKAAGIEYKDASGRVFNFHALRTQFGTWLAQNGVPIQHAQRLMRHSDPRLTIKFYTKLGDADLAAQLNKLPKRKDR